MPSIDVISTSGADAAAPPTVAPAATVSAPVKASAPPPATGGAAILARLRAQRLAMAAPKAAAPAAIVPPLVTFVYASQTGTASEIAKTLSAEAVEKGFKARALSFNDLGFNNISATNTPLLVIVASSTGDGDPPDNCATAWGQMVRAPASGQMKGVRYTALGLGDSNYTSFMHVPRRFRARVGELGGEMFYKQAEADEVDGIEDIAEPWTEGLWPALKQAIEDHMAGKAPVPLPGTATVAASATAAEPLQSVFKAAHPTVQVVDIILPAVVAAAVAPAAAVVAVPAAATAATTDVATTDAAIPAVPEASAAQAAPAAARESAASAATGDATTDAAITAGVGALAIGATAAVPAALAAAEAVGHPVREVERVAVKEDALLGLVSGLAPEGADLAGASPLLPCKTHMKVVSGAEEVAQVLRAEQLKLQGPQAGSVQQEPEGGFTASAPFWSSVIHARYETASWSDRKVLHLELSLAGSVGSGSSGGSALQYGPGDSVGILASNDPTLVAALLQRLGVAATDVFSLTPVDASGSSPQHLPSATSFGHAFSHCIDITSAPKKSLIRLLAEHAADPHEKRTLMFLCSRAGKAAYGHDILEHQPSLLDLLSRFPSAAPPPPAALLDLLSPLAPRLYSITSSPLERADALSVVFSVVAFRTRYGLRSGLATTWLDRGLGPMLQRQPPASSSAYASASLSAYASGSSSAQAGDAGSESGGSCAGTAAAAAAQAAGTDGEGTSNPPADLATPLIMIGPGTGVAPFRGFATHRSKRAKAAGTAFSSSVEGSEREFGRAVLYFGCRRRDEDFLYQREFEGMAEDGTLAQLRVAFSREQDSKVYVQQLLREDAASIHSLIAQGAHIYVCGDGASMVKDVHAALLHVISTAGGVDEQTAAATLAAMVQQRRYIRDIWS
ncbi:MAG: hypothetical protein WDW36_007784 [Sanguina aurantia]